MQAGLTNSSVCACTRRMDCSGGRPKKDCNQAILLLSLFHHTKTELSLAEEEEEEDIRRISDARDKHHQS